MRNLLKRAAAMIRFAALMAVLSGGAAAPAWSHALDPGFLSMQETGESVWRVFFRRPDVLGRPMELDAVLPENCEARRSGAPVYDGQAWGASWITTCEGGIAGRELVIEGLDNTNTDTLIRIQPLEGQMITTRLTASEISMVIPADPSLGEVFSSYIALGMEHILVGIDHLMFVFALLLLIRSPGKLIGAVTAFTVAHSITLALAAFQVIRIPGPPVEAVIALSIVFLCIEIIKSRDGEERLSERYPWMVSFSFGLLHGLGFAGVLIEIGLPQDDVPAALLAFNIGVEAGQLAFIAAVLAAGWALRRAMVSRGGNELLMNRVTPVMAYAVGGIATYWLAERISAF